jgi:hypothetical protein
MPSSLLWQALIRRHPYGRRKALQNLQAGVNQNAQGRPLKKVKVRKRSETKRSRQLAEMTGSAIEQPAGFV